MNRPIDVLYYQWATSEDEQKMPTIYEDIQKMTMEEKVDGLLGVFAHLTTGVVESQIEDMVLIEKYVSKAAEDAELSEMEEDSLIEAINDLDDVKESKQLVEEAENALNLFQRSFVKAIATEVE